ncbi:MAG: hypothetical protein QXK37_01180 [Candidatus Woesearchaeota archaeon]
MRQQKRNTVPFVMILFAVLITLPVVSAQENALRPVFEALEKLQFGPNYDKYYLIIDLLVWLIIFGGIAKFTLKSRLGNAASTGIGLLLALSVAFFEYISGGTFRIGNFWPIAIVALLLLFGVMFYQLIIGFGAKPRCAVAFAYILVYLMSEAMVPQFFAWLQRTGMGSLLYAVGLILSIIGIIIIIICVTEKFTDTTTSEVAKWPMPPLGAPEQRSPMPTQKISDFNDKQPASSAPQSYLKHSYAPKFGSKSENYPSSRQAIPSYIMPDNQNLKASPQESQKQGKLAIKPEGSAETKKDNLKQNDRSIRRPQTTTALQQQTQRHQQKRQGQKITPNIKILTPDTRGLFLDRKLRFRIDKKIESTFIIMNNSDTDVEEELSFSIKTFPHPNIPFTYLLKELYINGIPQAVFKNRFPCLLIKGKNEVKVTYKVQNNLYGRISKLELVLKVGSFEGNYKIEFFYPEPPKLTKPRNDYRFSISWSTEYDKKKIVKQIKEIDDYLSYLKQWGPQLYSALLNDKNFFKSYSYVKDLERMINTNSKKLDSILFSDFVGNVEKIHEQLKKYTPRF